MKGQTPTPKIAVIENSLFSTYTMREALMNALVRAGYEVTVITHANQYKRDVEKTGINVLDIGSGSVNPFRMGRYISRLYSSLKTVRPQVILTFSIRPAIFGNLIARLFNIPVITNITGTGPLFRSNGLAYSLARMIYKPALRKTAEVYFQNADDLREFVNRGFIAEERTKILPGSGIDYLKFRPVHLEKAANVPFVFLFIGRLIKDKGILEFLEASSALKERGLPVSCKILGPFWSQNLKANTLKPGDLDGWIENGTVHYLGEMQDVREQMAAADCVVLPSYREGISNVLLEAAAMEKPVITCDTTGCREIVENNVTGLLCRVKDSRDLAEKMLQMLQLSPEQREQMGKKARQKVIREFDKQIVIDTYFRAIERAIQGK